MDLCSPVSHQSVSVRWDDPKANRSLQSICLPLKVDLPQGRASLCTSEIRQGYFRDHTNFSLVLPLEKFPRGGNCVISVSAGVAPPGWKFISHSVPSSLFVPRQNNADQVAFQMGGGLSALEQILQVITVSSTPTAVPRIPLKWVPSPNCALLICISSEHFRFLFQARTAGKSEHEQWDTLKMLRNVYFSW